MNITRMPDQIGIRLTHPCECDADEGCGECDGTKRRLDDDLTWFPVIGMTMDEHYDGGGQAPQIIYVQDNTLKMVVARGAKVRFAMLDSMVSA